MKKSILYFIIAALFLLNLITFLKLNSLENNINSRSQKSDFAINDLKSQINDIYSNVETKLKKQGSILDKYNVTFGELDPSNFTIPITVSLTPKEYLKGLTANLQLKDKNVLMKNEGTDFIATIDAYIFDDFQLKVDLEEHGVEKVETIEEYHDLKNKYLLAIACGLSDQSTYSSEEYQYKGKINLSFGFPHVNSIEKVSIIDDVNGVVITERKVDPVKSASIDVKGNIKLVAGDRLTIYAMVKDGYGLNYKYVINVFEADINKNPVKGNEIDLLRGLAEISDRDGKILYARKNDMVR